MSTTTIEKKTATQIPAKAKTTRKKAVAAPMNPPTAPAVEGTNKTEVEAKKAQELKDIETLKEARKRNASISKSLNNVQSPLLGLLLISIGCIQLPLSVC